MRGNGMAALGRVVLARREHPIILKPSTKGVQWAFYYAMAILRSREHGVRTS
jgi:non-homologous end joining protein Ku